MNLNMNNQSIAIPKLEGFNSISLENNGQNPKMTIEYVETSPLKNLPNIGASTISYEKVEDTTKISYQKKLTEKSGLDMNITIGSDRTIPNGYIDFYTIKKSTTKRNNCYRLEFSDNIFKLYASTSRKYGCKKQIASYIIDGDITPGSLSMVITRMINTILKYAKEHDKQRIIKNMSSFQSIDNLLYLEMCALDNLKDTLEYCDLNEQDRETIKLFLQKYQGLENEPFTRNKTKNN